MTPSTFSVYLKGLGRLFAKLVPLAIMIWMGLGWLVLRALE